MRKETVGFRYGYYNITDMDKKYFKEWYEEQGYGKVFVKRIRTKKKGLNMYEIYRKVKVEE